MGDKNIQIDHSNINGLVNKLPEVQLLLEVANFDILGITETHLLKNIILVGDLNYDMTPGLESNESHFGRRFRRILCSYSLKNIINSPTRITSDSKSLIDLIVTSQPAKVQTSGSIDLGISDHHLIFSVFKRARSNPKSLVTSTKKYKQVGKNNLIQILSMLLGIL